MSDVTKLKERLDHLIARSASPEEEEARSAAFLACEMIRKHGVELQFPGQQKKPSDDDVILDALRKQAKSDQAKRAQRSAWAASVSENFAQREREERERQAREQAHIAATMAAMAEAKHRAAAVEAQPQSKAKLPRLIVANYSGTCVHCKAKFAEGDQIYWTRGGGTTCFACGPQESLTSP